MKHELLSTPAVADLIEKRTGWRPCDLAVRNWITDGTIGPKGKRVFLKAIKPSKNWLVELKNVERFIETVLTPESVASRSRMGTPKDQAATN